MPQSPTASDGPSIEIDVDEKYIAELVDWTEAPAQYPDAKPGEVSLTWKFRLTNNATGEMVTDMNTNGDPYELWQFSNDRTYRNEKSGKVAKAREWAEALLGKPLTDAQIQALNESGWAETLIGRKALADLEWYVTKTGNTRLKIIRMRPAKKQGAAAPVTVAAAVEAAPLPQAAAIPPSAAANRRATAIAALGLDDDEEEVAA